MTIIKKRLKRGIILSPDDIGVDGIEGEIKVGAASKKLHAYLDGALRNIVTESQFQSLTNKTIDVDVNILSNIETDNLKSGVLNVDTVLAGATDTQIPSALAVQSAISTTASNASTALSDHINDAVDAHDASAISNVPAGNLAATDVQGALNELQGDVDTLSSHVTNPTGAHAASAISNSPLGNLAATTVQGALNELQGALNDLQGDVDTRATSVAFTAHESSTVAHGATGAVVGTTNTQTLTNKTLTGASIESPIRSDVKKDTKANLVTYATTSPNGQLVFATDEKLMYQVVDSLLESVGSGNGSLATVFQLTAEELLADWTTGDNATFLGAGALSGTFVKNTATPLQGGASYVYTQAAGSLNDYLACPAKAVDVRFRGKDATLFFPFTYNGANNDIEVIFYDVTNAAIIPSSSFIQASTSVGIFKTNIPIPLTCASIRVGFQVKVLNSTRIFAFDSIELTADSTVYADIANMTDWASYTPLGSFTTNTTYSGMIRRMGDSAQIQILLNMAGAPNAGDLTFTSAQLLNGLGLSVDTSKLTLGTSAQTLVSIGTATMKDFNLANLGAMTVHWNKSSSTVSIAGYANTQFSNPGGPSTPIAYASGDTISLNITIPILGWTASNRNILTAPDTFSTDTAPLVFKATEVNANDPVGTFSTYTYAANTNTRSVSGSAPSQSIASMNQNGIQIFTRAFNAASTTGNPAAIAIQIGKGLKGTSLNLYKSAGKVTAGNIDFALFDTTESDGILNKTYNEVTGILYLDSGATRTSVISVSRFYFSDVTFQANGFLVINASKNPALTGLNIERVAARAVSTSGQVLNTIAATITWNSAKTYDTHNSLNTTTGIFTAPESGYYQVNAGIVFNSAAYTTGAAVWLVLFKNGILYSSGAQNRAWASITTNVGCGYSDVVYLSKGETIEMRGVNERGSTSLFSAVPDYNFLSIAKIE
jgi:hypothetical protein